MKLNDPTVSGSASDGTFIDKDERNGVAGTLIKAKVFNQLIYETNTLIKEGGLIPSDKDLTQIYTAIRNLYTNADNELKNYLDNKISIESSKIIEEIKERKNAVTNIESQIRDINMTIEETSSFIIKETITKLGSGTQSWALNWRSDLEYLQVAGYVSGNTNALSSLSSYGLYLSINDSAPFIGWFGSRSSHYYYGGEFQKSFTNYQAGLPNLKWFPILGSKPVLGMKNNSKNTITAYLYFLVRKK